MTSNNPTGLDGFEFLEFSTTTPEKLITQFTSMGFVLCAQHKSKNISIYQQAQIRFVINCETNSMATNFSKIHGPCVTAMGFHFKDATKAFKYTENKGARPYTKENKVYPLPAIYGVGESLIYFVDEQNSANWLQDFNICNQTTQTKQVGLTYIDHVTHNLKRGNMSEWANFYTELFNFHEVRYFDIEGRMTGLKSRAMASPCGKVRIPLNESSDEQSQIEEFIQDFNGEGIQHIALGTDDIYHSVDSLNQQGVEFLETPDTYYDLIEKRLPKHGEPMDNLKKLRILIDGTTQGEKKLLLQIFTQNMLGPVFFEIIQRKGDEGFGEGNFRALFESIELDQIRRGTIKETETEVS